MQIIKNYGNANNDGFYQESQNFLAFYNQSVLFSSEQTKSHFNTTFNDLNTFISRRVRSPNEETLVKATKKGNYRYWLSQEDIADIARVEYDFFHGMEENNAKFDILGSLGQLSTTLESFQSTIKADGLKKSRLTLIINLEKSHWVTLVIDYQDKNYLAYYTNSLDKPLPNQYLELLHDHFQMSISCLSSGFIQQQDGYNCGLWALENAADLNQMLDHNQRPIWLVNRLKRPRSKDYFDGKRISLSEKLNMDPIWRERNPTSLINLNTKRISASILETQPKFKQFKTLTIDKEKVIHSLETFVETFMSAFTKELGVSHLTAKDNSLSIEALRTELKTGLTGALLGITIADNYAGSIPSLVASFRAIASRYLPFKAKAQKITKIFSEFELEPLSIILSEVAVDIFYSFESQFMQMTDKAGDKMAIEKLAEDAAQRLFNALYKDFELDRPISKEYLEGCVLKGPSLDFFDPNLKRPRFKVSGHMLHTKQGKKINSGYLYEKIGLIEFDPIAQLNKFYVSKTHPHSKVGYRRLLEWEKDSNGLIKDRLKKIYIEEPVVSREDLASSFISREYDYVLSTETNQLEAKHILDKMKNRYPPQSVKKYESRKPIYFNLIKPVKNFSGRMDTLAKLHNILMSERTTAIIPSLSMLSLTFSRSSSLSSPNSDSSQASSGSQLSISGLGGIGKTQLALRYAELYASYYDHNVIWINAETLENVAHSFNDLAEKIKLSTRDRYHQEKSLTMLIEEVYDYFSDRKSLFIFDNVENYSIISNYLPKARPDNKPTILITSRYSNWDNIATTLSLDVFTEKETQELFKKSLALQTKAQYEQIHELNQLLQGLPLALQQALAYIKLRRKTNSHFSLADYIASYKEKSRELLDFDFSNFSNDPYLKTVFTTWLITLDKIKEHPLGEDAIEILNILAYLYPDNISNAKIFYFNHIKRNLSINDLNEIMQILSSYSMINAKNSSHYTIHRLVQQIIRLHLEKNRPQFEKVIEKTRKLIRNWQYVFKKDEEITFHYLHFLLYMSEHKELISKVVYQHPEAAFFDNLLMKNAKYCQYFMDLAYSKFAKEKFFIFLGEAIAYYIKIGAYFNLEEILAYIEKKWNKKILSIENIEYILTYYENLKNPVLKLSQLSSIRSKQENQRLAKEALTNFKFKIFGESFENYNSCSSRVKRSICLPFKARQEEITKTFDHSIKSHFEKIGRVSHYISSSLMTKDILSALIQGHFEEVAINLGFITSGAFFKKLSSNLLTKGKVLVSDTNLLEKNLVLKNNKILNILLDGKILSVDKKLILGKIMQLLSPAIAKTTSIYLAYILENEIQAYTMGNKTVLPNIVSNSIIVSIDGVEALVEGAELLEIIIGVSAFTGPIGQWITLLTWIGTDAYIAKQQIAEIEKYVHLSKEEEIFEFILAMLHQAPLEYAQIKADNGQRVENAINFLKNNTDIQWYTFPSAAFSEDLYKTRIVFLNEKIEFALDDSNPDKPVAGDLFCLAAAPPHYTTLNLNDFALSSLFNYILNLFNGVKILDEIDTIDTFDEKIANSFLCHKALGVNYILNRTSNVSLVNLGEGEDIVIGFSYLPNLFIIQNGKKIYVGGDAGNIFELSGNSITGKLQGGKETDILSLANFYPNNSHYLLLDSLGSLCGKNDSLLQQVPPLCSDKNRIQIDKIEQIYGRKNEVDIIYLDQSISLIDGYGGKNENHRDNLIITDNFNKDLKFVLRDNTLISFLSSLIPSIAVDYKIPFNEIGKAQILYYFNQPLQHRLFFECSVQNLANISITNNTVFISVFVENKQTFSISFSDPINFFPNKTNNQVLFPNRIHYLFKDMELKIINNEHLYGREINAYNKTLDEKITSFRNIANQLEKTFSIQLINNITISIGRENKHEIFYVTNLFENHLVGNGGENAYIILAGKKIKFPLPTIMLYNRLETDPEELIELKDSLDLREVIKEYQKIYPTAIISTQVFSKGNDLILTLSNSIYSPTDSSYNVDCFLPWLTIQLKNTLYNDINWYQKLDVFLDSNPRNIIALEDDFWELVAAPILFTEDKKIIFITYEDIEEESTLLLLKNIGKFAFFRDEMDLILTNALTFSIDYCTIIFYQFYKNLELRKKVLSSTLEFFDHKIHFQNYLKEIDHATHFQHLSQLVLSNITQVKARAFFNGIDIIPPTEVNEVKLRQQMRHKRHINQEENTTSDTLQNKLAIIKETKRPQSTKTYEEDHILTIADDYLKKYDHANSKNKNYHKKNQPQKQMKKTSSFDMRQEKYKSEKKQTHSSNSKANINYFKIKKLNYLDESNSNQIIAPPIKNQLKIVSNTRSSKEKYYKDSNLTIKNKFSINENLSYQLNSISKTKTTSIYPQLTHKRNQSNTKKTNHLSSSYIDQPNLHDTLLFINFITKASQGRSTPTSYNKKLNKMIQKTEKLKEKIKSQTFKINAKNF